MLKILYLILIMFFFIIELVTNKRFKNLFSVLIIIYLAILMGGSLENPDSLIYRNIFYRDFFSKDIGFGVLIYGLKSIGVTLNSFRLIVAIIGILLIHHTASKFVKNTSYFYILYAIYPFMFDIVQVRNFLAMSIFIYAVPWLLESEKKYLLKYIIAVSIAATMQKIAVLYLPLVFMRNLSNKNFQKYIVRIAIICSIFVGLFKRVLMEFSSAVLFPAADNLSGLSNYLNVNTRWGWIIFWGEQAVNFVLVLWANRIINDKVKNREVNMFYSEKTATFSELMYNVNLYMFIFLPLFVLDENFTRIIRNVMPLNLMVCSIAINMLIHDKSISIKRRNKNTVNAVLFTIITLLYQLFLLFMLCKTYWDSIVLPVFNNNWIW